MKKKIKNFIDGNKFLSSKIFRIKKIIFMSFKFEIRANLFANKLFHAFNILHVFEEITPETKKKKTS